MPKSNAEMVRSQYGPQAATSAGEWPVHHMLQAGAADNGRVLFAMPGNGDVQRSISAARNRIKPAYK